MKYYLSIGSNIEPLKNIIFSIKELKEILADINISNTYVTPSIGFEGPEFLNLIISGNTELSLEQLNALLKVIEDNAEIIWWKRMYKQPRLLTIHLQIHS